MSRDTVCDGTGYPTTPMHVLMVANNWVYGGLERVVTLLCEGFRDFLGWDVTLVVARCREARGATPVEQFPEPRGTAVQWLVTHRRRGIVFPLGRIIRRIQPDIVFWHADTASFPYYWLAAVLAGCSSRVVPVYHVTERPFGTSVRSRLSERLAGTVARMCCVSVAVSRGTASAVEKRFRVRPEAMHVVSNCVDAVDIRARAAEREPEELARKHPVVLVVARLSPQKDWETLIGAFKTVAAVTRANLCIVGEGEERDRIIQLAQNAGVVDRVTLVGNQSNPYAYMAHADAFVLCSHYEGFGMVLLEAMACGVPIVATDCESGPREVVTHGQNGMLVPPGDPATLAEGILAVLTDADLAQHLRHGGLKRASEFSLHDAVEAYRQVAERVCGRAQ
jgi:glycosyltransferase involved in cell wall biosynthesis